MRHRLARGGGEGGGHAGVDVRAEENRGPSARILKKEDREEKKRKRKENESGKKSRLQLTLPCL